MILMGDGSVRFLGNEIDPELLKTMADLPPVAPAKSVKVPDRKFEYASPTWTMTSLDLGGAEDEELSALAWHDPSGSVRTVLIYPSTKFDSRPSTVEDLQAIAKRYPEVRILLRVSRIDDEAAQVLSGLKQLEFLQAESIEITQTGLASLQNLPRLRVLRASMTEEMQQRLAKALPECELRNTGF